MVPSRPSRRRDRLPRVDGHFGHHLQRVALVEFPGGYPERLCDACPGLFWVDRDCDLFVSSVDFWVVCGEIDWWTLCGRFTCEMADESTGLLAAAFIGIVPGKPSAAKPVSPWCSRCPP